MIKPAVQPSSVSLVNEELVGALHLGSPVSRQSQGRNMGFMACYRCGSRNHIGNFQKCPAMGKRCIACGKTGHFKSVCRSVKKPTRVNVVDLEQENLLVEDFSNAVLSVECCVVTDVKYIKDPLFEISIEGSKLQAMADSGSPVTILSNDTYNSLFMSKVLLASDINPKAYGGSDIPMLGYFNGELIFMDRVITTKIYIAKKKEKNIVGWRDLAKMRVILVPGSSTPVVQRTFNSFD